MPDSLPRVPGDWAPYQEAFHDIAHIVAMAASFVLVPVAVPGPDLARALGLWLSQSGHPVETLELIGDAEWEQLAGFLLSRSPPPEGVVMIIGSAAPPKGVSSALSLVNQARDAIVKSLKRPLLWCGPRSFLNLTWERAPDFWSIRSVDHTLEAPLPTRMPVDEVGRSAEHPPAPPTLQTPTRTYSNALVREAVVQGDPVSAAILAAREAENALAGGDAEMALRMVDDRLSGSATLPGDMQQRLAVLRARALSKLGRVERAQAEIDTLLRSKSLPPAMELDVLLEKANLATRAGDLQGAERGFREAQALAERVKSPEKRALARVGQGEVAMALGRGEEARRTLSEAAKEAQHLGDDRVARIAGAALARALEQTYDSAAARRVAGESALDDEHLALVYEAAVKTGIDRETLLAGINRQVVASLPQASSPREQLLLDLRGLNTITLLDGRRPIETWLRTAEHMAMPRREAAVFQEALGTLRGTGLSPSVAISPPVAPSTGVSRPLESMELHKESLQGRKEGPPLWIVLYAPKDERYADELRQHVASLLREGLMRWWSMGDIRAGEVATRVMAQRMAEADAVIALVSADFVASRSLGALVQGAIEAGKRVVPVRVRAAALESSVFGARLSLPRSGKPLSQLSASNRDLAWAEIVQDLRRVLAADRNTPPRSRS